MAVILFSPKVLLFYVIRLISAVSGGLVLLCLYFAWSTVYTDTLVPALDAIVQANAHESLLYCKCICNTHAF